MQISEAYYKTIRHFFKGFSQWVKDEIPDWRDQRKIDYSVRDMIATGILIFLLKLGSRRALNEQRDRGAFVSNAKGLFHAKGIAHGDSLSNFLKKLEPKYPHGLRVKMIRCLLRNKVLDQFRLLNGYVLVAIDGTWSIQFGKPHCSECLRHKLNNGEMIYYHPVLEAKIVCHNGFAFSIGTEYLRNEDGQTKQDCELKAFYRLAPKIKKDFPQLRICLLGDGLYACEPVFKICSEYEWAYLITLTDDRLSTIWDEVKGLRSLQKENYHRRQWVKPVKITEEYWWTLDIEYHGHTVHVLEYQEKKEGKEKPSRWAWVTNLKVTARNCVGFVQYGGRDRWKIENEGFNTQKNGGYGMEHIWSENIQAQENFYILMQIGHMINQLVEKGSLLKEVFKKRVPSLKAITLELISEMKVLLMPWEIWRKENHRGFQIRLNDTS